MSKYFLGKDAARFSVVSFANNARTRVPWSYNAAVINAGIDAMKAQGKTSISDGFEAAGLLFNDSRPGAAKVLLLFSDGGQTVDAAPGKTATETAIDAAALLKGNGVTVFAWGFGKKVSNITLMQIATDSSKAQLVQNLNELESYLEGLEATICNESPPLSPPQPSPSPPSPSPPPPEVKCGSDKKKCKIQDCEFKVQSEECKIQDCEKVTGKIQACCACKSACKNDRKKKKPLCQKTCCGLP